MTTRRLFKFVVTLALVFAVAGGYGVFTAKASIKSPSSVRGGNAPPTRSGNEIQKAERFAYGSAGGLNLPTATQVFIDGTTLNCPGFGSCSYAADEWLQIRSSSSSNWAVFTTVDGFFMAGGPFLGPTFTTDYTAGSWNEYTTRRFAPGNHILLTYAFMRDFPGNAYAYNFSYRVFKP